MILNFQKKEEIIRKIREISEGALSVVVASLDGVSTNAMTQLRKEARCCDVSLHVLRNTLIRRVFNGTSYSCLTDILIGSSVLAFSKNKPSSAARIFVEFSKNNENFKIKGAVFEGKFIEASKIDLLSTLPDYKEAIAKMISMMRVSFIGCLVNILYMISNQKDGL